MLVCLFCTICEEGHIVQSVAYYESNTSLFCHLFTVCLSRAALFCLLCILCEQGHIVLSVV